jgi:heme exporter protein B
VNAFWVILQRDLKLSFRRWSELANPLIFFVIVAALFPLGLAPDAGQLELIGAGVVWMAALLASLLALDGLFRNDAEDGSLEQLMLSPASLGLVVLGKIAAHWIASSAPLIVLGPAVALAFGLPADALPTLVAALLLATPTLSVLAAVGAALTLELKNAGAIIGLLVLPLATPLLIFGARATDLSAHGEATAGPLYLLAALAVLGVSVGPVAIAAALRVGME